MYTVQVRTFDYKVIPWTLWVWERALASRGSSFTNTKLQRRRATTSPPTFKKRKIKKSQTVQLRAWINICLTTTDHFLPIIAWTYNDDNFSLSSQLVPSNPPEKSFIFVCLPLAVWLCLKKVLWKWVLVMLLQIGAKDLKVWITRIYQIILWKWHPDCFLQSLLETAVNGKSICGHHSLD